MLTIYQAEGAYWNLYFAQEQIRFFDESVSVAQDVLGDTKEKLKAGQGAELDVMEAQSALALRNTKRNDAVQNYYDALGHLRILTGTAPSAFTPATGGTELRAVDDPHSTRCAADLWRCRGRNLSAQSGISHPAEKDGSRSGAPEALPKINYCRS